MQVMKPPPAPSPEMLAAGVVIAAAVANAGGVTKARAKLSRVVDMLRERYMMDGIAEVYIGIWGYGLMGIWYCICI
jgi:hypothetical protein